MASVVASAAGNPNPGLQAKILKESSGKRQKVFEEQSPNAIESFTGSNAERNTMDV